jgi:hypothetical protein
MPEAAMQVDTAALIEEMAAIYFHVELDENPSSVDLAQWREKIQTEMTSLCAEMFELDPGGTELEIILIEGSLWAKLKPKLATIGLILSLYNGIHNLPPNLMNDLELFSQAGKAVVEKVTDGYVDRIEGPWKHSEIFREIVERIDPTTPQTDE